MAIDKIDIIKKTLIFKFDAGTSRGVYKTRDVYYVVIYSNGKFGVGEAAPLPKLSIDDIDDFEQKLRYFCDKLQIQGYIDYEAMRNYPAMLFALENALLHLEHQDLIMFNTNFTQKHEAIIINGLVWMGSYELMRERLIKKIEQGFKCIKIKIGAIDFNQELALIQKIRSDFDEKTLQIRVDANGAFDMSNVMTVLEQLKQYDIHSIEQPIKAGQILNMQKLIKDSPLAIALDEELILNTSYEQKEYLLDVLKPNYIVLKPSLHGGIKFCNEWIKLALAHNCHYWITSALESNIGLNLIAQYASSLNINIPQGLGTGQLYHNNIDFCLRLDGQELYFDKDKVASINFKDYLYA